MKKRRTGREIKEKERGRGIEGGKKKKRNEDN